MANRSKHELPLAVDVVTINAMIDAAIQQGVLEECEEFSALVDDDPEPLGGPYYDLDFHIDLVVDGKDGL